MRSSIFAWNCVGTQLQQQLVNADPVKLASVKKVAAMFQVRRLSGVLVWEGSNDQEVTNSWVLDEGFLVLATLVEQGTRRFIVINMTG